MQLQQLISKFVLLAMLLTVFSSTVNAGSLHQMTMHMQTMQDNTGCHSAMTCCSKRDSSPEQSPSHCNTLAMDAHTANTGNCCIDNDCHANGMQLAIISNFNAISVPSATQVFTEPVSKRLYFYEVLLRPPVLL